jgi:hypothetical protein
MSDVREDLSKYALSGLIAVSSFMAARIFDRFDKGNERNDKSNQEQAVAIAVLRTRVDALEDALRDLRDALNEVLKS